MATQTQAGCSLKREPRRPGPTLHTLDTTPRRGLRGTAQHQSRDREDERGRASQPRSSDSRWVLIAAVWPRPG
jgi:hypothetical protein